MSLYVHSLSRTQLTAALANESASLLISGPSGIGLLTVANDALRSLGAVVLTVLPEKDEKVDLEKGRITVDVVRKLYEQTKTVSQQPRVVIIDYSERMATPAQNAFLKLLEEPPQNTRFILLTHTPETLLPTIRSRTQHIVLQPISDVQTNELLNDLGVHDATKRAQLLFIARGLPAHITTLVEDEKLFSARAAIVKDARTFISGSPYDRLLIAKQYKDNRENALQLLVDALKQLKTSFTAQPEARTLAMLEKLERSHKTLTEQGNVRLQLSALAVL